MSRYDFDVVVVGSGAGGSIAADVLSAAGLQVCVLEEGPLRDRARNLERFSLAGMTSHYRGGGQQVALGSPMVALAEGIGLGGSTEVNAGLYHRPPESLLGKWDTQVAAGLSARILTECAAIEQRLNVSTDPSGLSQSGDLIAAGADALGWDWADVPRWTRRSASGGERFTARTVFLTAACEAGAQVRTGVRVIRVTGDPGTQTVHAVSAQGPVRLTARAVVLAAGALGTVRLLRASGVRGSVGSTLKLHPMVKLAARFDDPTLTGANSEFDIASVQVREFAPTMTLGSAASSPALMGSTLARTSVPLDHVADRFEDIVLVYAAACPATVGRIRRGGVVQYHMDDEAFELLPTGIERLAELMLAAGASAVAPAAAGASWVTSPAAARRAVTRKTVDVSSVHLTSTVPLGGGAVDQYGQVAGRPGLYVMDAAALPSAPGVNPQGTVMAIAAANARALAARLRVEATA